MNALITIVILTAVALLCARAEHKRFERAAARDALNRARATDPPATQAELTADRERLIAAIRDDRSDKQYERERADWALWEDDMKTGSGL